MRKLLQLLALILLNSALLAQAQFETGKIGVQINSYGRIRVHAPAIDNFRQMDRISALVGVDSTGVYDYKKDSEENDAPVLIAGPAISDYEIYGTFSNAYSNAFPNFLLKMNVYGWNNTSYIIVKYTAVNNEATALNSVFGLEVNPQLDGSYGTEVFRFLPDTKVLNAYKSEKVGIKFLSADIVSLKLFEYFDTYTDLDSDLWKWLTHGKIDPEYASGGDGAVAVPAIPPENVNAGDSLVVWLAIAAGASEAEMLAGITDAVAKYNTVTDVRQTSSLPVEFALLQNYPNPFNPGTRISFSLPNKEYVDLTVFNSLGQIVSRVVSSEFDPGSYTVDFDASNLTTGIYFYSIKAGNYSSTKKMMVIK